MTPGVPAYAAAAALLGRELTVPELAQTVILTRTYAESTTMPDSESLARLAESRATLVLHLAIRHPADLCRLVPATVPLARCRGLAGDPAGRADLGRHAGRYRRSGRTRRVAAGGGDHGRRGAAAEDFVDRTSTANDHEGADLSGVVDPAADVLRRVDTPPLPTDVCDDPMINRQLMSMVLGSRSASVVMLTSSSVRPTWLPTTTGV